MTEGSSPAEALIAGLPAAAQPIRAALFAILRKGQPATQDDVADATNRTPDEVAAVLAALRAVGVVLCDDGGRVVAADGLSLTATPHQLLLDGIA